MHKDAVQGGGDQGHRRGRRLHRYKAATLQVSHKPMRRDARHGFVGNVDPLQASCRGARKKVSAISLGAAGELERDGHCGTIEDRLEWR
jgi:hypothetical protein